MQGGKVPYTASGYFDDFEAAAYFSAQMDVLKTPAGAYMTLNPVSRDLFARSANVITEYSKNTTADTDVPHRTNLLIDVDPTRPAGISSSQEELDRAEKVAGQVLSYLTDEGWPSPLRCLSSNGFHLLYAVDMPNTPEVNDAIRRFLEGLNAKFAQDTGVSIDRMVFNAARITKLYGTVSRKGSNILERPHRQSLVLDGPDARIPIVLDKLLESLAKLPVPEQKTSPTVQRDHQGNIQSKLMVEKWLTDRGIHYKIKDKLSDGRVVYILSVCPFNDDHGSNNEVCIMQGPDGKMYAECKHDHCPYGWQEFKQKIGPPRADHYDPPLTKKKRQRPILPANVFPMTDLGNSERFVNLYGKNARYNEDKTTWMSWCGTHWRDNAMCNIEALAHNTVRSIQKEAADAVTQEQKDALTSWATQSESREKIMAIPALAKSKLSCSQADFDDKPWLLNVLNGTLDLRTGNIRSHCRDDMITAIAPVVFDKDAKCPTWENFLNEIFRGDTDTIKCVQRMIGYSITGVISEHIMPVMYGSGANGKSTFINAILALLGPQYSMKATSTLLMESKYEGHPTEKADLYNKRFVAAIETSEGKRLDEALVKELTGGDDLRARKMRQDFFQFRATHKPWLTTNHKPSVRGSDHGIWRRLKLIPFTAIIPNEQQDGELPLKLIQEMPGILNWAIAGCLEWQKSGVGTSEAIEKATAEYRSEMDILGQFIDDECLVGEKFSVLATDLYTAYRRWCLDSGNKPMAKIRLGLSLTERGFPQVRNASSRRRMGLKLIIGNQGMTINKPLDTVNQQG